MAPSAAQSYSISDWWLIEEDYYSSLAEDEGGVMTEGARGRLLVQLT